MAIQPIDLEKMGIKGETLYQSIVITAKRARQINDEIKTEYMARISTLVPMEEDDDEIETTNFDQMRISLEIEKRGKPTAEALKDFLGDKLTFRYRDRNPDAE
jgi:DNA-directed RNA polymerase subunit K/omega